MLYINKFWWLSVAHMCNWVMPVTEWMTYILLNRLYNKGGMLIVFRQIKFCAFLVFFFFFVFLKLQNNRNIHVCVLNLYHMFKMTLLNNGSKEYLKRTKKTTFLSIRKQVVSYLNFIEKLDFNFIVNEFKKKIDLFTD